MLLIKTIKRKEKVKKDNDLTPNKNQIINMMICSIKNYLKFIFFKIYIEENKLCVFDGQNHYAALRSAWA